MKHCTFRCSVQNHNPLWMKPKKLLPMSPQSWWQHDWGSASWRKVSFVIVSPWFSSVIRVKSQNESGERGGTFVPKKPTKWSQGIRKTLKLSFQDETVTRPRSISGLRYFCGIQLIIINQNKHLQSLSSWSSNYYLYSWLQWTLIAGRYEVFICLWSADPPS